MFLLKEPTQWHRWGSNPRSRVKHSTTEPPWVCSWCLLNLLKFLISLSHHMFLELKSRPDEIGLLSTPNMCCGLVKGKVILHPALLSCGCGWFCFVWFDSLRLINNLSVIKGLVFLGWTSTKLGLMFLLKDTTQWRRWGSNPRSRVKNSTTEPLRSQGCVVDAY